MSIARRCIGSSDVGRCQILVRRVERGALPAVIVVMGESQHILVVDDHPDCAEVVCDLLWLMGHECHSVSTGAHALDRVRALNPDLVLLDLTLPDMSGLDVARAIRRDPLPQPYLVAMTGWSHPDDRHRTLAAGFDAHLVKPVSTAILEQIVSATRLRKKAPALAIVR